MTLLNIAASLCRTLLTVSLTLLATSAAALLIDLIFGLIHELTLSLTVALIAAVTVLALWFAAQRLAEYGISTYLDAIHVVILTWTLAPLICAIPFLINGLDPVDSLFEAISGLTGTGLSVLEDVSSQPVLIRLWRSVLQWFGEIGIIVVTLAIFAKPGSPIMYLYVAEGREERLSVTVWRTVKLMLRIYILYTAIGVVLYTLAGLDIFDAVCLAMTTIATGGFTPVTGGFAALRSAVPGWWILYVAAVILMVFGALNFRDHARLFTRRIREFFSPELKLFLIVYGLLLGVIIGAYILVEHRPVLEAIELGVFHLTSALTTTGFQLEDLQNYTDFTKLILTLAMIIGGCTCSTAGGIKVLRLAVLFKSVSWTIQEFVKPRGALIKRTVCGLRIEHEDVVRTLQFVLLYFLVLLICTLVLTASGYRLVDSLFEAASALSCAGLSTGITSENMPVHCKITLMIAMLIGRLEIMPWLISVGFLAEQLRRKKKVLLSRLAAWH